MFIIQYKHLLRLRGVTSLPPGETLGSTLRKTGGDPTEKELEEMNSEVIKSLLEEVRTLKERCCKVEMEKVKLQNDYDEYKDSTRHAFTI